MLYLVIFIIILILLAVILSSNVNIYVEYIKNDKGVKNKAEVKISLFRNMFSFKVNRKLLTKYRLLNKKEEHIDSITQRILYWLDLYKQNLDILVDHRKYLNSKIKIRRYNLNIEYGTDDAAITGILYGVAWSLVTVLEAAVFHDKSIRESEVNIKPNFNKICFNTSFSCIFSLKTVHIIVAGYKTLKWYLKRKYIYSKNKGGDVVG